MSITVTEQHPKLKQAEELGRFIGNTPLMPIRGLHDNDRVQILAKLEWQQLGGSVKSRPAYRIILDALKRGQLGNGQRLLDASSGNTGIAYAHVAARLGIPVTLCLPENASAERKQILRALGVEIIYTSRFGGTDEAQEKARELAEASPELYYYADQYNNDSNWKAHFDTTGSEIIRQTEGRVTHFVAGLGTTGTMTGIGRRLKRYDDGIQLVGLQPDIAMHGMEGWKHLETAHVPGIYDGTLPDRIMEISTERAYETIKRAGRDEGLLLSPSAGANLAGALQLAGQLDEGVIVTTFADDASKYGEVMDQLFNQANNEKNHED